MQALTAMFALRLYLNRNELVLQVPLHEGCGDGIFRSGRIQLLAGIKPEFMRGSFNGYGISPAYRAMLVTHQEEALCFQLLQYIYHLVQW